MSDEQAFSVTCPCCGALLTVDGAARVVTGHEVAQSPGEKASFDARLKTLDEEKRIAEEKFQESIRAEKSKKDVLEKKFQDLFQKAKEGPVGPVQRDIDLD
jgi:hypothetical protein